MEELHGTNKGIDSTSLTPVLFDEVWTLNDDDADDDDV